MADFFEIHRKDLNAADGKIRQWELWNVVLREPLQRVSNKPLTENEMTATIVTFRAMPGGKLEPANKWDREAIDDWKLRHRDTSEKAFGLPELFHSQPFTKE